MRRISSKNFFLERGQKREWPIEADNEQFNLLGSKTLRRDKFIRYKFGATRLLPSPSLFSNRRNHDTRLPPGYTIYRIEWNRENRSF